MLAPGLVPLAAGQATLPVYRSYTAPSPAPTAPGDAYAPTMSGSAASKTPVCGEWTRTAGPDESVVITGINFSGYSSTDEGKDSRFVLYDGTAVAKSARIQRLDSSKAIVTLARNAAPWSMYLLWPGNEHGYGAPIAINKTDAWWVGPDQATQGDTVSVYGRNLAYRNDTLAAYVYVKPATGTGQWAAVTRVNPYRVTFKVPAGLAAGSYEVWAHNGHGGQYGWSGPLKLTLSTPAAWSATVYNVKNYGATGNGSTDDTPAIRAALAAAKNVANSTVYFPAGTYMVSDYLEPGSNTRWLGAGRSSTVLKCAANFSSQAFAMLYGSPVNTEIRSMSFDGNHNYRGVQPEPIFLRGSKNLKFVNLSFSFQGYNTFQLDNTYRTFVTKCEVIGKTAFLGHASQLFIDRCQFKMTDDAEMALDSWGGAYISLTNSTCQDLDNSNPNDGAGWGKGRFYAGRGNFGSSTGTYIAYNRTLDLAVRPVGADQNSGEQYMWEGYTTDWAGSLTSSTASSTTLSGFSASYSDTHYAIITRGRGQGQARRIVSYTNGTIGLEAPWNLLPDATSIIAVANANNESVLYRNYIDGKAASVPNVDHNASAGIEPYGATLNFIAAHNTLHDLRVAIANWATQNNNELDPNFFSTYANNTIQNCRWAIQNGLWMSNAKSYSGMFGIIYRKNTATDIVQSAIVNTLTAGGTGVFTNFIYEHNRLLNVGNGFSTGGDPGLPPGFPSGGSGIESQFFYKNAFKSVNSSSNFGVRMTSKTIMRENTLTSFATTYTGMASQVVLEAPVHAIDAAGTAGSTAVASSNLTLWNSGAVPITWALASSAPWLTIAAPNGTTTTERDSSVVQLRANPAGLAPGIYTATITAAATGQTRKYTVNYVVRQPILPVVSLVPFANSSYPAASPINLEATASTASGTIEKVEFYVGATKVGEDTTSPYSYAWSTASPGTYSIVAKAISNDGQSASSTPADLSVVSPMPVALIAFAAAPENQAVRVRWATASEQNNAGFRVQRSADGQHFAALATVAGHQTSTQEHHYTWLDATPLPGTSYYRLEQFDTNGARSYSPVATVHHTSEPAIGLPYPSPATTYLVLPDLAGASGATYRVLNTVAATLLAGTTTSGATLNVAGLAPGLYYLELTVDGQKVVRKFAKEN